MGENEGGDIFSRARAFGFSSLKRRTNIKKLALIIVLFLVVFPVSIISTASFEVPYSAHQCRLWGITANSIPHDAVIDQLVNLPNSLEALAVSNPNGWGLAYYLSAEPVVIRGQPPANVDPNFLVAARQVADSGGTVALGHIRKASSGLTNIPDPHPFERFKNGRWWLFCHNGGIDKNILINLIGTQYLAQNPPSVGNNQNEWIDSELYFIYVLKCCEENGWNVTRGITTAIVNICNQVPGTGETLNFLLTDGETLWGFRKGNTLYYYYVPQYSAIASQYPTRTQGAWVAISDFYLTTLVRGLAPLTTRLCYKTTVQVKDLSTGAPINSAKIYIDGVYMGTTDRTGKLVLDTVASGWHTFKATKTGYSDSSTSSNISSDKTVTLGLKKQ